MMQQFPYPRKDAVTDEPLIEAILRRWSPVAFSSEPIEPNLELLAKNMPQQIEMQKSFSPNGGLTVNNTKLPRWSC